MIMRNDRKEAGNETERVFTKLIKIASQYLLIIESDFQNHTIRALLPTRTSTHMVIVAYDSTSEKLTFFISLDMKVQITGAYIGILFRLQNQFWNSLSKILADQESGKINIGSCAKLAAPNLLNDLFKETYKDTVQLLENQDLQLLVN